MCSDVFRVFAFEFYGLVVPRARIVNRRTQGRKDAGTQRRSTEN